MALFRRPVALLLVVGAITHFAFLANPRQVVFDEVTFGKYVAAYCCTGQRIFDVHPPHGKLLIALGAKLGGFRGDFTFDHIGEPYGSQPVLALRFVPALMGAITPCLFFLFLLQLKASRPIALLGGLLVALDNALISDSRIIVFDSILVASTIAALTCFLAAQRSTRISWQLIAAGLLAGMAVGTKTTGLAVFGVMGLCWIFGMGVVTAPFSARARQALIIAVTAFAVYAAGWILHWLLLQNPGPGDAFYTSTGHMMRDLLTGHRTMLEQNVALNATHPDASRAWTWPLMKVAPYLWQGEGAQLYMVGNPMVWWGSTLVLVSVIVQFLILRPLGMRMPPPVNAAPRLWVALAAYAIAFLPLWPITRVLFLYHYQTPLLFGLAFVLLWLDRTGWVTTSSTGQPRNSYLAVIALAVVGFLIMSPLTYGFSVGGYDEALASVVRSWR